MTATTLCYPRDGDGMSAVLVEQVLVEQVLVELGL